MDLNDQLTPNEHGDLRDRVVGGAKRMRAARARRSRIVAGAAASALVAVVVAGVTFAALRPDDRIATPVETSTPAPTPTPTPTPTGEPAPTPTATPDPEPQLLAPTMAFEGDCAQVVDTGALSASLGVEVGPATDVSTPEVRTLGGLGCSWESATFESVTVYALPASVVPAGVVSTYSDTVCEGFSYDNEGCRRALSDDDTWMLVTVSGLFGQAAGVSNEVVTARLDAVAPLFISALADAGRPTPAARTAAWWSPTTCDELLQQVSVADILGTTDFVEGYPSAFGTDVHIEIARDAGLGTVCRWYAPNSARLDAVIVTIYPGGAWEWDRLAAGDRRQDVPVSVDVAGATEAVRGVGAIRPDSSYLLATDGVNVVEIMEAPDVVDAAERVLSAMRDATG
ncbi:hypothetical protein QE367_001191 [Microbacterium paludicola]|uniref:DUF3558 domain-containing protein n=1 Tax=Microbacterium paludicola TaxID=300019 RepID=A0ABU1HZB5_9MICO|nr:hypothetical protein [Microbacterium paludicola]MDR6166987.1 hypothetical protein [Microbacterium paludicola]